MTVNPAGGSGSDEGRDSWCTPKWLADLIGKVDLDVASNRRSHIQAAVSLIGDEGDNGLAEAGGTRCYSQRPRDGRLDGAFWGVDRSAIVKVETVVFCNPPYVRGQVIRWIKHWRSTRFVFLLRWDPSTEWFAELIPHCTHVWFPARRINFEPPPGVKSSSNPFPHALYLRKPDGALLDRLSTSGYLIPIDQELLDFYIAGDDSGEHDGRDAQGDDGADAEGVGAESGAGGSGGEAGAGVGEVSGIAKWIPASKPKPKTKWGIDYGWLDEYGWTRDEWEKAAREAQKAAEQRARDYAERSKAAGGCGACDDCLYGLGFCVFQTQQDYRDYIRKLQGWK